MRGSRPDALDKWGQKQSEKFTAVSRSWLERHPDEAQVIALVFTYFYVAYKRRFGFKDDF